MLATALEKVFRRLEAVFRHFGRDAEIQAKDGGLPYRPEPKPCS
jgi:hypothetical protein